MSLPLVLKFGGTSLAGPTRVLRAARRARWHAGRGRDVVVVVSAVGRTTDRLLERVARVGAPRLAGGGPPDVAEGDAGREADRLLATGEDRSAALLALALLRLGRPARSLRGGEAGLVAVGGFGRGRIDSADPAPVRALLGSGCIPVVSGFQAARGDGETVTLGRGGSDVSAVALAAALGGECHIVTDVPGVCDRDPAIDPAATLLPALDHGRLLALVEAGAAVVHPAAARLAADARVPLRVYHFGAAAGRPGGTRVGVALARAAGGGV